MLLLTASLGGGEVCAKGYAAITRTISSVLQA